MTERRRILQLYEKGYKISHIARIIGVTHSCVSKIMTRYRRTGSMSPRSSSGSRPLSHEFCSEISELEKNRNTSDEEKSLSVEKEQIIVENSSNHNMQKTYSIERLLYGC
ncbi:hypothetical protein AB6A40_011256 [Gnathostoma spinigerum]|uniref:Paired domain-containing protein n=1 Tax=Gnathostoma spinigerum TaxID=75299 RepID=A0ABD6F443_9BILA